MRLICVNCNETMKNILTMNTIETDGLKIIKSETLYQCPSCRHVVNIVDNTERDINVEDNIEPPFI